MQFIKVAPSRARWKQPFKMQNFQEKQQNGRAVLNPRAIKYRKTI
jgi:hypothetical protein